jgi:hypothetical protein
VIRQMPGLEDPGPVPSRREARNAVDWYERIVADSFGT